MNFIKKIILKCLNKNRMAYVMLVYKYYNKFRSIPKTLAFGFKSLFQFYTPKKNSLKGVETRQLLKKCQIKIDNEQRFIYYIDIYKTIYREKYIIDNVSLDYNKVLNTSLKELKEINQKLKDSDYKKSQEELLIGIEEYIDRLCQDIEKSNRDDKEKLISYFNNIKTKKAESFEEAIQRILFFNQLLWQTGHSLNGLGRLDKILGSYYDKDIKNKNLTKKQAQEMLTDFVFILHKNFWYKSSTLIGDTGQIIILGGLEPDGSYFYNDLTYMFIEIMKEAQIPDPKVFLRVSKDIPRSLMEKSLECIKTGVGCPLFSNDDVIIPKLIEFGFDKKDAYNYVTSACWEPLIAGKSVDQNNIDSIVYMVPFLEMFEKENLEDLSSFQKLKSKYMEYLEKYLNKFIDEIKKVTYEEAPLFSLFTDDCNKKLKDVSEGGAKYANSGVTSVSLGNVVNSLYNLKKYVYDEKKYTLEELNKIRKDNFAGHDEILNLLKKQPKRYGTDDPDIIKLSNEITTFVDKTLDKKTNNYGGKFKFGLSAPSYIMKSNVPASFDGRHNNEPFGVHISSDKPSVAYTELIQFASKLDYSNHRFNGNVIDFMITPSFIENNFNKMVDFLTLSIPLGFFQMQMNVTSSDILIKAKANPKEYEHLIVRVWGFSAYFNDLPESYKDLLIERALKNEGKSY